jgi:hypothetical protein
MKFTLTVYNELKQKVQFLYRKLNLNKYEKTKGRKLKIPLVEIITLGIYRQTQGKETKKALWKDLQNHLGCSYKTLVVNLNRSLLLTLLIIQKILGKNRQNSHWLKHTDSTDIPVCLNKNATRHKTMYGLAEWGHSGKGMFYGLKLHLTSDLNRKILSISFAKGNVSDKAMFMKLNKDLEGIFVADAGYVSEKLEQEFYIENKRILFSKPRKNMKKVITYFQKKLYDTRMTIEINFRNLKMLYNLVTSFPRSIDGYLANYVHSVLAYILK